MRKRKLKASEVSKPFSIIEMLEPRLLYSADLLPGNSIADADEVKVVWPPEKSLLAGLQVSQAQGLPGAGQEAYPEDQISHTNLVTSQISVTPEVSHAGSLTALADSADAQLNTVLAETAVQSSDQPYPGARDSSEKEVDGVATDASFSSIEFSLSNLTTANLAHTTLSFWVYVGSVDSSEVLARINSGGDELVVARHDSRIELTLQHGETAFQLFRSDSDVLHEESWAHVALSDDGNGVLIYIDAVRYAQQTPAANDSGFGNQGLKSVGEASEVSAWQSQSISREYGANASAFVDDVRHYQRVLTDAEIIGLYKDINNGARDLPHSATGLHQVNTGAHSQLIADDSNSIASESAPVVAETVLVESLQKEIAHHPVETRQLLIIDRQIVGFETFIDDVTSSSNGIEYDILTIGQTESGIDSVTKYLADSGLYAAVHIVGHGTDGHLQLGGDVLTSATLATYQDELSSWAQSLGIDADILIYGCDIAASSQGQSLIRQIATLTDADIAASNDLTGHSVLGADWDLEYQHGTIDTALAFSAEQQVNWQHTLDISTGLVAHYEFEENGGSTATDSTISGNDGTWSNAPSWSTDSATGAYSLDFTGDSLIANAVVTVADDISLDFNGDFSVAFWYNSSVVQDNGTRIVGSHDGTDGFSIYADTDGSLNFYLDGSTSSLVVSETGGFVADGNWHHVVATNTGGNLRFYIDNVAAASLSGAVGTVDPVAPLTIGGESTTQGDFEGKLDDVRIYTRALSVGDVNELYNHTGNTAQTFTVVNTSDSGPGSLRQAIVDANANVGVIDRIEFNIPGGGAQEISLLSALNPIADPVVVDGTTQAGWVDSSYLPVVVDGGGVGSGIVLDASADGSEIRGLVLRDFGTAIYVEQNSDNHVIAGNWIGQFNSDGTDAGIGEAITGQGVFGDGNNVTVGGTTSLDRNVIVTDGNLSAGIYQYTSSGWNISGNFFGTDTTGNALLASTTTPGVGYLTTNSSALNTIGGTTDSHRNIFAGLAEAIEFQDFTTQPNYVYNNWIGLGADGETVLGNVVGISAFDTHHLVIGGVGLGNTIVGSSSYGIGAWNSNQDTQILGNSIGRNESGTVIAGNVAGGIYVDNVLGANFTIGGNSAGAGNVITANGGNAITVTDVDSSVTIRGNSIYRNAGIGIDLGDDGVTNNDAADIDSGANTMQNWPVLKAVGISDTGVLSYAFDDSTLAASGYTLDFYASTDRNSGQVEGERYLGAVSGYDPGVDSPSGSITGITVAPGEYVTLVATDSSGNSSEFSNYVVVTDTDTGGTPPKGIQATATTDGGLALNHDGGDDSNLIVQSDGSANSIGGLLGSLTSFTVELDFALADANRQTLVSYAATEPDGNDFFIRVGESSGYGYIEVLLNGTPNQVIAIAENYNFLFDGNRHQLAFSWDNGSGDWSLYIDGEFRESGTGIAAGETVSGDINTGTLMFGQEQDRLNGGFSANDTFRGTYYDARIFADVRTPDEIARYYAYDVAHDESGLLANWQFDQLSPDRQVIDTVHGNNLELQRVSIPGFSSGSPSLQFSVLENPADGAIVGKVHGIDAERDAQIAAYLAGDPDLRYSNESGKFYRLWSGAGLYPSAVANASGQTLGGVGGELAIVSSAHENAVLKNLYDAMGLSGGVWLGATDDAVEGEWRWANGQQFWQGTGTGSSVGNVYTNFSATEPDNSGNEDYLVFTATGHWDDTLASGSGNAFLQWDADTVLDITHALTWSIQSETVTGAFEIDSDTGELRVLNGSLIDYDANSVHSVTVRVQDANGNTADQPVSIAVKNDSAPTDIAPVSSRGGDLSLNQGSGNNAYLQADDAGAILGGKGEFTIEARLTAGATPVNTRVLDYATAAQADELALLLSGDIVQVIIAGNTYSFTGSYTEIRDGEQHSLGIVRDGVGTLKLYIDGVFKEQVSASNVLLGSGGSLIVGNDQSVIGSGFSTIEYLQGAIDDIRIFSDVRSDIEIASSYASVLPADEAGLVANWRFEGLSSEGVVTDAVHGNNLTIKSATGAGFIASEPALTFEVNDNSLTGEVVGAVSATDAERVAKIESLLAADSSLYYSAETEKFYKVVVGAVDWIDAKARAELTALNSVNGQLAVIRSADENEFIRDIANANTAGPVWLGGTDAGVEGEWRWINNGAEADRIWDGSINGYRSGEYVNWSTTQPNGSAGEDAIRLDSVDGKWHDAPVSGAAHHYIVEWTANSVLDVTHKLTYSIASQTVDGAFAIDSDSGELRVADGTLLDADTLGTHQLTVLVTDLESNTYDKVFAVFLNKGIDSDAVPTDLSSGIELNLDGGNDAVLISNSGLSQNLQATTIEIQFVASAANNGSEPTLLGYYDGSEDALAIMFNDAFGGLELDFGTGVAIANDIDYLATLFDGQRHTLSVTWDNSNGAWSLFVDGQLVESGVGLATGQTIDTMSGRFVLGNDEDLGGGNFDPDQRFTGTIHDVRIWDNARSAADIRLNYQHKLDLTPAEAASIGLVANWQMDGFNGSSEVVDTAAANNLTISHASGAGFSASVPAADLNVDENASNGTRVGYVVPSERNIGRDILVDGRFLEAPVPTVETTLTAGATFGDWTVTSGSIDQTPLTVLAGPTGGMTIDLSGDEAGTIASSTLSTDVGRVYQVTFALNGNFAGGDQFAKQVRVAAGGMSEDFTVEHIGADWKNEHWEYRTFTFVADSPATVLSIESGDTSPFGPYIADISIVELPAAVQRILNSDASIAYDASTDKFYRFVNSAVNFDVALAGATGSLLNGVTGQLITIHSDYENTLVRQYAMDSGNELWLGATDENSDGSWNWLELDTESAQPFWTGGNSGGVATGFYAPEFGQSGAVGEDYARLIATGNWADDTATGNNAYIIEWNASEVIAGYTYSFASNGDAGGRFNIDSSTGELTVANGALLDYEASATHQVTVDVSDVTGNTYSEVLTVLVNNRYELTQSVPGSQTATVSAPLVFSAANGNAITPGDSIAGNDSRLQVYLTTGFNGTLTLSQTTGLTIGGGSNGGTFMSIQGAESDINAAFEGMVFTPVSGYTGPVTLTVTSSLGADLEGRYEFNGNANDTSLGLTQHGTFIGGATTATDGVRGEVLQLDAAGEQVEITSRFNEPSNVTVAAWVNLDAGRVNADIISLGNNLGLRADDPAEGLSLYYYQGAAAWKYVGDVKVDLDGAGWSHVAATFDDSNDRVALFLNGTEVARFHTTDSINWADDADTRVTTVIGAHGNFSSSFDFSGRLDDVRVYDRALTPGEIVALAQEHTCVTNTIDITVTAVNQPPYFSSLPEAQARLVASGITGATAVTSADLDADGDIDLISATDSGQLRWHENDGDGNFSLGTLIDSEQSFNSVVAVDVDGDTDIDIVAANDDPANLDNGVFVYSNNHFGTGVISFSELSFEGSGFGDYQGAQQIAVGDIDKNGLTDIVVTFYNGIGDSHLVMYEQESIGNWVESAIHSFTQTGYDVSLADIDGDSYLDIVALEFNGPNQVIYFRNDQSANPVFGANVVGSSTAGFTLDTGDLDGDGDIDIAVGSWGDDEVAWFENDGSGNSFVHHTVYRDTGSTFHHVDLADINADGSLDILVSSSNNGEIRLFKNDGGGEFTGSLLEANGNRPEWVEAADVDGDGAVDVIFASNNGNSIQVHGNQGSGGFIRGSVNEDVSLGALNVQIADDDAGAGIVELTIDVAEGDISLDSTGVTVVAGASGTSTVTFEGTIASVNAALSSLVYTPGTDFNGIGEVQITVDDRGNTGAGGALSASETIFIEVLPQPDSPIDAHYTTWMGGDEFIVNSETSDSQAKPSVASLVNGGFVVAWESLDQDSAGTSGVYFQRYDNNGNPVGTETLVNQTVAADQESVSVTGVSNGGFVIVWHSDDGADSTVRMRSYNASGNATSAETTVNTTLANDQDSPSITALNSGGYVVAWSSFGQDGDGDGIYFQRYNNGSVPQGTETRINSVTTGNQSDIRLSATGDGGFVAVWEGDSTGSKEIYAQRYNASGNALGSNLIINATTIGTQDDARVTALTNGGFVVTWESEDGQDGDGNGLFGQLLSASGTATGAEFQINTHTVDAQRHQCVVGLADGGFIVLWESAGALDGSGTGVFAQQFDATGNRVNGEFQVNSTTASTQSDPDVSLLNDGRLLAAWESDGQDGSGGAVVSRIFQSTLNENSPAGTVAAVLSRVVDPDGNDSYTYSLTDDAGGAFDINSTTGTITVLNPGLLDFESSPSMSVTVRVADPIVGWHDEVVTIGLINRAEVEQQLPADSAGAEDTAHTFSGANAIRVTDTLSDSNIPLLVSLQVNDGVLTLSGLAGITIVEGSDNSSSMTISGTESNVNTALDGLSFTPDVDYHGSATISVSTALAANLEAHYTFEGRNASDQSIGISADGVLKGNATTVIDPERGEVLSLDGDGDHVEIASTFTDPQDVTVSTWINVSGIDSGGATYVELGSGIGIWTADSGSYANGVQAFAYNGTTYQTVGVTEPVVGTGWRHIAVSHSSADQLLSFYLDGQLVAERGTSGAVDFGVGESTFIGTHGTYDRDMTGMIGDTRVYSRTLSAEEVSVLATDNAETTGFVTHTVVSVNDPPVLSGLDTPNYIRGGPPVVLNPDATVFDAELSVANNFDQTTLYIGRASGANADDTFTATGLLSPLTDGGSLVYNGSTVGSVNINAGGEMVLQFNSMATNAEVNAVLQSIAYANTSDNPPTSVKLNWTFNDVNTAGAQGSGGARWDAQDVIVNIQDGTVLDITAPADVSTSEDTALVYAGANVVQIDDGLIADSLLQVSLSVVSGTLTLAGTTGITFVEGGNGTSAMVIDGRQSDINTALDGLTFTPHSNFSGSDTLAIATSVAAGLQGHYTFEGDGSDQSAGVADDGALMLGATVVNDAERGNVLSVGEGQSRVQISGMYGSPANVTLAAWVNLSTADSLGADIISLGDNITLRGDQIANGVQLIYRHTSGVSAVSSSTDIAGTGWRHIAVSFDDDNNVQALYIDGQRVNATNHLNSISWSAGSDTVIGRNGNNSSSYDFNGLIDDARIYTRVLSDEEIAALATDQFAVTENVGITVTPVNQQPVIGDLAGDTLLYTEGDGVQFIDQTMAATVTDPNLAGFDGGSLLVSFESGTEAGEDVLAVVGSGAGQVAVVGGNVLYGGVVIGSFTGGSNGNALQISFNASADTTAVTALIRSIGYENTNSFNPASGDRAVSYVVTDGSGYTSTSADAIVSVTAINNPPQINLQSSLTVNEDESLVFSSTNGNAISINDLDSAAGDIRANITVTNGIFTLSGITGLASQSGNGTGSVTIEGPNTAIFAALNGASYTPQQNFNGVATLTMIADDLGNSGSGGAQSDSAVMNINVEPVNDNPANAGTLVANIAVIEDIPAAIDLGGIDLIDVDADSDALTLTINSVFGGALQADNTGGLIVNGVAVGTVSLSGTLIELNQWLDTAGSLTYTPVSNTVGVGADRLDISINDNGNNGVGNGSGVVLGSVQVDVASVNDAPSGTDSQVSTMEELPYVFTVPDFGYSDVLDGDGFQAVVLQDGPVNGVITLANRVVTSGAVLPVSDIAAGLVRYTPYTDGYGQDWDRFTFSVQDDGGNAFGGVDKDTIARTITINVDGVNDAPVGQSLSVAIAEDMDLVIAASNFGFSDVSDGDQFDHIIVTALPVQGELLLDGVALVTVSQVSIADINAGRLVYRPESQLNGADEIVFRVVDDGGTPGVNTSVLSYILRIEIEGVNDAPTGQDNRVTSDEDMPYVFSPSDFGFFDGRDVNDQLAAVVIESLPGRGALTVAGLAVSSGLAIDVQDIVNGQLQFLAETDQFGVAYTDFTFRVRDDNEQAGPDTDVVARTITIDIRPVSDAPAGVSKRVAAVEDTDYIVALDDFGFNNVDIGDVLVAVIVETIPVSGMLYVGSLEVTPGMAITANEFVAGNVLYRPDVNFHGDDQLRFRLQDSGTLADTSTGIVSNISDYSYTLTFAIASVNDAPSGTDRTIIVSKDSVYTFVRGEFGFSDAADVIDNLQLQAITITSLPDIGRLTVDGIDVIAGQIVDVGDIDAGLLQYQPPANTASSGYRGFAFQVHDTGGVAHNGIDIDQSPNQINFDVLNTNDSPLLLLNGATVAEGGSIVIDTNMLFGTDADDPDPNDLMLTITTLPEHGELLVDGTVVSVGDRFSLQTIVDEALSYTHDESETSQDQFGVSLIDGGEDGSQQATGEFVLDITEVIDPAPVVENDQLNLDFGQTFDSTVGDLLASGYSALNKGYLGIQHEFTVTVEQPPAHGTVDLRADGTFRYEHDGSRIYLDEFRYRVTNEDGVFTIATVSIAIQPPIGGAFGEVVVPLPTESEIEPDSATDDRRASGEAVEVEAPTPNEGIGAAHALSKLSSEQRQLSRVAPSLSEFGVIQTEVSQSDFVADTSEWLGIRQHKKVDTATFDATDLETVGQTTMQILLEVNVPTARDLASNPYFVKGLSQLEDDLEEAKSNANLRFTLAEETVLAASFSASVGVISWALRGGALFASLMSVGPLWWTVDLTKISIKSERDKNEQESDNPLDDDNAVDDGGLEMIFEDDR